jgi:glutathione S-transferase
VLRVDDKVIAQTGAIARFCGKLSGLYPNDDPLQAAEVDQVIDAATDITNLFSASMREKDVARKMALREALAHGKLPIWLGYLERLLVQNGKTGFFVGQQLTIADLAIWRLVDWLTGGILDGVPQNVVDPFPLLKHHHAEIGNLAKVKEWMEKQYGK